MQTTPITNPYIFLKICLHTIAFANPWCSRSHNPDVANKPASQAARVGFVDFAQRTTMTELVGTPCSASGIVSPSPTGHLALLHDVERKGLPAASVYLKAK